MSVGMERSAVARLQKEIADLRTKDAQEAKKEAELGAKLNRANSDTRSTKSASTQSTKLREAERHVSDLASVQKRRADLASKLAGKANDLNRRQSALEKEEERERAKITAAEKKLQKDRDAQIKQLERRLADMRDMTAPAAMEIEDMRAEYDVFISHASEDKAGFVAPLAARLIELGLAVWYDDRVLKWGDSLRRKIDEGLARSRFGVVVLSEHFFRKEWPQRELDGLVQLETLGRSRILPIWHKVSKDEVAAFSPTLADKIAMNSSVQTIDEMARELLLVSGKDAEAEDSSAETAL